MYPIPDSKHGGRDVSSAESLAASILKELASFSRNWWWNLLSGNGLIQSGGFGSFSKNYGTAAAGLLEAEIVTADGAVRIANASANPDLFWGIKGGGGGSLGVVTKLTLRTRELPAFFGGVFATIKAASAF